MSELIPTILIILGAFILVISLLQTGNILKLIEESRKRGSWHILRMLMAFFSIGYIMAVIALYYTKNGLAFEGTNIVVIIMGIIFFLGALFVYLVVRVSYQTIITLTETQHIIEEQKKEAEKNNQIQALNNEELTKKNKELEEFNAKISSDLNKPLRLIVSLSDILISDEEVKNSKNISTNIGHINKTAKLTQQFITDLLRYSEMNTHEIPKEVDVNQILTKVVNELELLINKHKAIINFKLLPTVTVPPILLENVFIHLITNSILFKQAKISPIVDITYVTQQNKYIFQVQDNGKGMPASFLKNAFIIFKKNHQGGQSNSSGIGLTYCKKAVQSWDGEIWAASILRKGTLISFSVFK